MTRKTDLPDLQFEIDLWRSGLSRVAGLDEAGRGALAGPVAVGAVILPPDPHLSRILACVRDSKQMTPRQRDLCVPGIQVTALAWSVAYASPEEIDRLGIVSAIRLAGMRALDALTRQPIFLLTDFRLELPESELPQTSLPKGDSRCMSIAAASVLAKTARDALMRELDGQYPGYGLGQNKGYGTQAHRSALKRLGYSSVHRKTFSLKT
ncbi:MAG: ribonuclease HII [Anaerolineales bacterium]|nr:ribonuclease HII [Anaerolineales bacterium]